MSLGVPNLGGHEQHRHEQDTHRSDLRYASECQENYAKTTGRTAGGKLIGIALAAINHCDAIDV